VSRFDHIMPESIEEAMALAATNGSRILAGGTDLLREIHAGSAEAARLVSLRAVPGLDRIERTPKGGLFIGARVTLAELGAHRDIRKEWTALSDAALGAASPPLRNVATIAGNLLQRPACEYYRTDFQCAMKGGIDCPARPGDNTHHAIFGGGACVSAHPSDAAAALLVLDARIHSNGPKGLRTRPVADPPPPAPPKSHSSPATSSPPSNCRRQRVSASMFKRVNARHGRSRWLESRRGWTSTSPAAFARRESPSAAWRRSPGHCRRWRPGFAAG